MALIRATCSECGDVELRSRDVQVRICADTGEGTYLLRCPVCRMTEVKNADDQVIDILAAAGVRCVEWRLPAELAERPTGEPISHDDVLDFHEILGGTDWFTTLCESSSVHTQALVLSDGVLAAVLEKPLVAHKASKKEPMMSASSNPHPRVCSEIISAEQAQDDGINWYLVLTELFPLE